MRAKKRTPLRLFWVVLLVLSLTLSSFGALADDPFGPLPEKITLTVFKSESADDLGLDPGETLTDNKYVNVIGERLNITYEFPITMKSGPEADDRMKLLVASNDIPDVMLVDYNLFLQMYKSGMIEDLTEAYERFASQGVRDCYATDGGAALGLSTRDGKLYGLPRMGTVHNSDPLIWLRKDWLDNLGLNPPSTMDELKVILKAFIEDDPDGNGENDTVGLAAQQLFANEVGQMFSLDAVFDYYQAYVKTWIIDEDGALQYGSVMPQAKDALACLQEMYAEGLIPKDFPISKQDQAVELVVSGKAGAFFGPWWAGWWPLTDAIKANPEADWQPYVLKDISGGHAAKQEAPISRIAVLKKGSNPEALVKSINYFYEMTEGNPENAGGDLYDGRLPGWVTFPIAIGLWRADAVIMTHDCMVAASKGEPFPISLAQSTADYYATVAGWYNNGIDWMKANPDHYGEPVSRFIAAGAIKDAGVTPIYSAFYGTTPSMPRRKPNLDTLETQAMLGIIVGDQPLSHFDEFVAQWKTMGGDEIAAEIIEILK